MAKTIIFVDSDKLLLDLLAQHLRNAGAEVLLAGSSEAGMKLCHAAGHRAGAVAINPNVPNSEFLIRAVQESLRGLRIMALVDSDVMAEFARNLNIEIIDKRQQSAAVFDSLLRAAGLPASARASCERVLIVDDEEGIRDFLSIYLRSRGYATSVARDGEEALCLLNRDPEFAVVLLDIMMPRKGGMEVLAEMRRLKRRPEIIMMTALADSEIARQALKQGAFNYILKPLDLTELESSISACVHHSQYRKNRLFRSKSTTA